MVEGEQGQKIDTQHDSTGCPIKVSQRLGSTPSVVPETTGFAEHGAVSDLKFGDGATGKREKGQMQRPACLNRS